MGAVISAVFARVFPWILSLLTKLFPFFTTLLLAFLEKIVAFFTFKLAFISAYLAAVLAIFVFFYSVIGGLVSLLSLSFPSEYVDFFAIFMPDNLKTCLSIVFSARVAKMAIEWKIRTVEQVVKKI